jgi:hypothetical protein
MWNDPPEVIEPDSGEHFSAEVLEHIVGYAVKVTTHAGTAVSGTVIASGESALIFNRWDERHSSGTVDPIVMTIDSLLQVVVF